MGQFRPLSINTAVRSDPIHRERMFISIGPDSGRRRDFNEQELSILLEKRGLVSINSLEEPQRTSVLGDVIPTGPEQFKFPNRQNQARSEIRSLRSQPIIHCDSSEAADVQAHIKMTARLCVPLEYAWW